MHSKEDIKKLLASTNDSRFDGEIKSLKRFFSLSNDVYKVDLTDGRSFVVKIEDPSKINLLTFYKPKSVELLKKMEYGSEIFLYSKNYLEIESFIKSKGLNQNDFVDPVFRDNIMRNCAEFNTIAFDSAQENFWNLIGQKKIMEVYQQNLIQEIQIYKENFKVPELSEDSFGWEMKDGLVGKSEMQNNLKIILCQF